MTPCHSRTSRVPGLKETDGVGLAAPRLGGPAAACASFRAVAMERPHVSLCRVAHVQRLVRPLIVVAVDEVVEFRLQITIHCGSPAADLATLNCQRQTSGDRCRKGARAALGGDHLRAARGVAAASSDARCAPRQAYYRAAVRFFEWCDRLRCESFGWARFALGSFPLGQMNHTCAKMGSNCL